jgi:hypothetical protein
MVVSIPANLPQSLGSGYAGLGGKEKSAWTVLGRFDGSRRAFRAGSEVHARAMF